MLLWRFLYALAELSFLRRGDARGERLLSGQIRGWSVKCIAGLLRVFVIVDY